MSYRLLPGFFMTCHNVHALRVFMNSTGKVRTHMHAPLVGEWTARLSISGVTARARTVGRARPATSALRVTFTFRRTVGRTDRRIL
jgi:hypothetical protein